MGRLKMPESKMRYGKNARAENAGVENANRTDTMWRESLKLLPKIILRLLSE